MPFLHCLHCLLGAPLASTPSPCRRPDAPDPAPFQRLWVNAPANTQRFRNICVRSAAGSSVAVASVQIGSGCGAVHCAPTPAVVLCRRRRSILHGRSNRSRRRTVPRLRFGRRARMRWCEPYTAHQFLSCVRDHGGLQAGAVSARESLRTCAARTRAGWQSVGFLRCSFLCRWRLHCPTYAGSTVGA